MKVAIVMRGDSIAGGGGAERRFGRLFEHLCADSQVHLVVNSNLLNSLIEARIVRHDYVEAEREHSCGRQSAQLHVYQDTPCSQLRNMLGFNLFAMGVVQTNCIGVVHLPLLQMSLLPFYMWLFLRPLIKVVSTVAFSGFATNTKLPISLILLARLVWCRADVIDSLYSSFTVAHGAPFQRKVRVTPGSFTDTDEFSPVYPKAKVIVFAGRLISEKNPLLLINAINWLHMNDPCVLDEWHVYVFGQGELEQQVKQAVAEMGLADIVTVGSVPNISKFLRRSRIFTSMQNTENYPSQSLLEAMASGNAIVATNVGETRRLVDEEVGLLIPPSDVQAAAFALRTLMGDEERCLRFGSAARQRVIEHFSLSQFAHYIKGVWSNA